MCCGIFSVLFHVLFVFASYYVSIRSHQSYSNVLDRLYCRLLRFPSFSSPLFHRVLVTRGSCNACCMFSPFLKVNPLLPFAPPPPSRRRNPRRSPRPSKGSGGRRAATAPKEYRATPIGSCGSPSLGTRQTSSCSSSSAFRRSGGSFGSACPIRCVLFLRFALVLHYC